jgi:hypothetical protein
MKINPLGKVVAGSALVATLGLAATAQATTFVDIPGTGFAGIAGNGNSGTDAFGQPWTWSKTLGGNGVAKGLSVWGLPGLGDGEVNHYEGSVPAADFFISFLTSTTGAFIDTKASALPTGYDEETRFTVCSTTCVAWTPVYDPATNPLEVNFLAPAGSTLVKGDEYFVNAVFTNGKLSGKDAGFSAVFAAPAPEPAAWALMLIGIAGVGGAMRSARRKHASALAI